MRVDNDGYECHPMRVDNDGYECHPMRVDNDGYECHPMRVENMGMNITPCGLITMGRNVTPCGTRQVKAEYIIKLHKRLYIMKKNLIYMGMGAMALVTPLLLSSCSSDDPSGQVAPTPTGETVKTSFTLSVGLPGGGSSSSAKGNFGTRMGEDVTQAQTSPVFRGMDNMTLIPFANVKDAVTSDASRLGNSNISLPNAVANTLTKDQLTKTGNAHVYSDVSIPLTTNAFLFYAKAIDGTTAGTAISSDVEKAQYGTLTAAKLDEGAPANITFSPVQIADNLSTTKGKAIATYLTSIANAQASGTYTKKWSEVVADAQGQGKALHDLYAAFIQLSAGSSTNIQAVVQDLYTSLLSIKSSQTTENQGVVDAITKAITNTTYASATDGKLTFTDAISGYPADNNLPDGAATLKWENNAFEAQTGSAYTVDGVSVSAMDKYVYPANLWYRANTLIKTDDAERGDLYGNNDNTATTSDWATILDKYTEDNGSVKVSTRSIALKNQIQYAVARLDTKVTTAATLYDHAGQAVTIKDGGFPITAILVGNQRVANWEFKPNDVADNAVQYTVYDKTMPSNMIASTSGSPVNHTLLLETVESKPVNIVVEFTNNSGNDFRGHNNELIPAGAKFYMVAKLDPTATSDVTQPSKDANINQVFLQDYTTVANLSINTNSDTNHDKGLGAAYNVIPDLRTPALSIGLSVDLTWQSGLTFNIDM